nr:flagellar hook protein FlgE [Chthonobacter albigriseus]
MNKSVSGLTAQSFALENISGNIANSQTTAFKRTDTSFQDLIQSGTSKVEQMAAGNVLASSRSTIGLQGSVEASQTKTFMAVQGNGFFVVQKKTGEIDGEAVFSPTTMYSRRGDFKLDQEGYLVNGAGYYLSGLEVDSSTGNAVGDKPGVIKIKNDVYPAAPTTRIDYKLNLPNYPKTVNADSTIAGSELWSTPVTSVTSAELDDFKENSISGGTVTVYDPMGTPIPVQLRWAKTVKADSTVPVEDTWRLFYQTDENASGTDPIWLDTGQAYTFDSSGAMTAPATGSISIANFTAGGTNLGTITLDHGTTGITQTYDQNGSARVRQLTQDGVPTGNFVDVSISTGGRITANYSNGKTLDIYEIPLKSFAGESWLRPQDGGAYMETRESGPPVTSSTGEIQGSALEASNVDISEEFTKLIVTQQAFSANSRVITTADSMMNDVLNIIR